jgi:hypothetical protein
MVNRFAMTADTHDLPGVWSTLSYLGAVSGTPTNYFDIEPPEGVPPRYPRVKCQFQIRDGRGLAPHFSVDRQGFMLVAHPEGVMLDFRDERALRSRYYPVLERLVRDVTGARKVLVFDHTHRSSAVSQRAADRTDIAVDEVHNDYTASSGPRRVRELLEQLAPEEDADSLMRRRFAVFNIWRPTNGVVEQWPLALCDMRTMSPNDFVDAELKWPHRTGFVCAVRNKSTHGWYYFRAVDSDEAVVFKCYDSVASGGVRFGAHTAFVDPTSPPGAKVRESIEARTIAFY